MPEFRKVTRVPDDAVGLAYVATTARSAREIITVTDAAGRPSERRRIMYADLVGRLITADGRSTIESAFPIVTDLFYDRDKDSILDANEVYPEAALPFYYRSLRTYYGPRIVGAGARVSPTGAEPIALVDADGNRYDGRYVILLERSDSDTVAVTAGEHEGYVTYWVHVFVDRDDANLQLRYTAGDIVNGTPSDVVAGHAEDITPAEVYHYTSVATATDPSSEGKHLVASQATDGGSELYVSEKARIDPRIVDPFYWRIRGDVTHTTSMAAFGRETVRIGVVGPVSDSLAAWLNSSSQYHFRMQFSNPNPRGSANRHWNVGAKDLSSYDVVIFTGISVDWDLWAPRAGAMTARGGLVIIDSGASDCAVTDTTSAAGHLGMDYGVKYTPSAVTGVDWLRNQTAGYDLSGDDLLAACARAELQDITATAGHTIDATKRLVWTADSHTLLYQARDRVFISALGLSAMVNDAQGQLLLNLIWGSGIVGQNRQASTSADNVYSICSPWCPAWVAGTDVDGGFILSSEEAVRYSFRTVEDPATGEKRYERTLDARPAATIIRQEAARQGHDDWLSVDSTIRYYLEIAGASAFVDAPDELTPSMRPYAYSTRTDSPSFHPGPAWRIGSYTVPAVPESRPASIGDAQMTVQVVGTLADVDTYDFTWELDELVNYSVTSATTKEVPLDLNSGAVDFVTTWSDVHWTAPNVLSDKNPISAYNLTHYGTQTATKWYPWDGQSFLATLNRNHGDYVRYVQRALNALAEVGRGHRTGTLAVDGSYGPRTDAAVRDYQRRWSLTVDGDVDAGTAGHIMRNAATLTNWANLDERWKKFGPVENILDNNWDTAHGRRTWLNSKVSHMSDEIYIYLKDGVRVTKLSVAPTLYRGSGAEYLHIFQIGGRRHANHGRYDWSFDASSNLSRSLNIYDGRISTFDLDLPNELDQLTLKFFQNNSYGENAKQWAFRTVMFYGLVNTTTTTQHTKKVVYSVNRMCMVAAGDSLVYQVSPALPIGATFVSWQRTANQIAAAIKASIQPEEVQALMNVTVTINATTGVLTVTFTPTLSEDANETKLGTAVTFPLRRHQLYSYERDVAETGTATSGDATSLYNTNKNWAASTFAGGSIRITGGQGAGQVRTISDNTATRIIVTTNWAVNPNSTSTYEITAPRCTHWPAFTGLDVDDRAWQIVYRVRTTAGQAHGLGCFIVTDAAGNPQYAVSQLTYSEMQKLGADRVKIGATNLNLFGDENIGGADVFPMRFAMKPFCVIERSAEGAYGCNGLVGAGPAEPWGVSVETGTVMRQVGIPSQGITPDADNRNNVTADAAWIDRYRGQTVTATYRIGSSAFSTTYGEPFVDIVNEIATWIGEDEIQLLNTPLLVGDTYDANGAVVALTSPTKPSATLTVASVDVATGRVKFTSDTTLDPASDTVVATYTYREIFVRYLGASDDRFDLCPFNGHDMDLDGTATAGRNLVGVPIHLYVMPAVVHVGTTVATRARTLFHTAFGDMFDPDSPFYNPLALRVATVTVGSASDGTITIVDTRQGGGGLPDSAIKDVRRDPAMLSSYGFNELDGFFDIGHLDGDAYLRGGTVVVTLPHEWRDAWTARGLAAADIDKMAARVVARWAPAGKNACIRWDDATDVFDVTDFNDPDIE